MALRTASLNLARVAIGPLLAKTLQAGELLPDEAAEIVRLLKLFWFLAAEHLRSSEGTKSWEWCQHIAYSFATETEIEEFVREHGTYQLGGHRYDVWGSSACGTPIEPAMAGQVPLGRRKEGDLGIVDNLSNGRMVDTYNFLNANKAAGEKSLAAILSRVRHEGHNTDSPSALGRQQSRQIEHAKAAAANKSPLRTRQTIGGIEATRQHLETNRHFLVDPTRAKPAKVIMWLNTLTFAVRDHLSNQ